MPGRIDDKVCVVTGAASGIGRTICERFLDEGASIVAIDLDEAGLATLADQRAGADLIPVVRDVTDESALGTALDIAAERTGGFDVLVANAGRGTFAPILDHDVDEWRAILDLCLTGVFLTIKCGGRHLRDGGSIITLASLNATQPAAGMSAYCAAKAGVVALTQVAAMELGARGIRANAIAPGLIPTAATDPFWAVPGLIEEFVDNTTVGRVGDTKDVAAMALFLASDESRFVSAATMVVDGGASTKRYPDLPTAIARLGDA